MNAGTFVDRFGRFQIHKPERGFSKCTNASAVV